MSSAARTRERPLPSAVELAAAIEAELTTRPPASPRAAGRRAAVLILLYDRDTVAHLILTKRTEDLPHHPGQISLPGGRWEPADGHLRTTALRETHEEIGVAPATVRVVGHLGDVETMVSGFVVRPFIGVSQEQVAVTPSEREIARVLEVSVAELLAADAALPPAPDLTSLRYPLLGEDVWGATARILHAFSGVVRTAVAGLG